MVSTITSDNRSLLEIDVIEYVGKIDRLIKGVIRNTPYSNDKLMCHRLYISCLISLLKSVTLSNHNRDRLYDKDNKLRINIDHLLENMYYEENVNSPTV